VAIGYDLSATSTLLIWALSRFQHPVGNDLSIAVGNGFPATT
jgi:hypothetical protein